MRASNWEFRYRALLFGMVFWISFSFYAIDRQNVTAFLANGIEHRFAINADLLGRAILFGAAILCALAALVRTWASAYLHAGIVYAPEIKTSALVADGPYRFVRNPLYFGNVLLAIGTGALMSRTGFLFVVIAMIFFCYRLILREQGELENAHATPYTAYLRAVPVLWPALAPRIRASGQRPNWAAALKAECWCWGFAVGVLAFAITFKLPLFFMGLAVGIVLLWTISALGPKHPAVSSNPRPQS